MLKNCWARETSEVKCSRVCRFFVFFFFPQRYFPLSCAMFQFWNQMKRVDVKLAANSWTYQSARLGSAKDLCTILGLTTSRDSVSKHRLVSDLSNMDEFPFNPEHITEHGCFLYWPHLNLLQVEVFLLQATEPLCSFNGLQTADKQTNKQTNEQMNHQKDRHFI